jgi:hypothetical protein
MGTMNADAERRHHEIEKQILDLLEVYEEAVVDRAARPPGSARSSGSCESARLRGGSALRSAASCESAMFQFLPPITPT